MSTRYKNKKQAEAEPDDPAARSEVIRLIKKAMVEVEEKQETVKKEINAVYDRIASHIETYQEAVNDPEIDLMKTDHRYLATTNEWDYAVNNRNDTWKQQLHYLDPEYNHIMRGVASSIKTIEDKQMRQDFRQLLNDYRRMFLHVEYIRDVDASPRYLDDIKIWITSFNDDELYQPVFTDKRLKRILDMSVAKMKEVKGLQAMIEKISDGFTGVSSLIENQIMEQYKRQEAMKSIARRGTSVFLTNFRVGGSIGVYQDPMEEAKFLCGEMELVIDDLDDLKSALEIKERETLELDIKIAELTKQIEANEAYLKDIETKGSPADKLRAEIDTDLNSFLRPLIKMMDTLYRAVEPFLRDEEAQMDDIASCNRLIAGLEQTNSELAKKFEKGSKKLPSLTSEFRESAMWQKCKTPGAAEMGKNLVEIIDDFQFEAVPLQEEAMFRIHSEKKCPQERDESTLDEAEIAHLRSGPAGDTTVNSAIVLTIKMCEKLVSEFTRLSRITRGRDACLMTLRHKENEISLEIGLKQVELLKNIVSQRKKSSDGKTKGVAPSKGGAKEAQSSKGGGAKAVMKSKAKIESDLETADATRKGAKLEKKEGIKQVGDKPPSEPSAEAKSQPSSEPSAAARVQPSAGSRAAARDQPSAELGAAERGQPSAGPSAEAKAQPSAEPSAAAKGQPSAGPGAAERGQPSAVPSAAERGQPSAVPSAAERGQPSAGPSAAARAQPSEGTRAAAEAHERQRASAAYSTTTEESDYDEAEVVPRENWRTAEAGRRERAESSSSSVDQKMSPYVSTARERIPSMLSERRKWSRAESGGRYSLSHENLLSSLSSRSRKATLRSITPKPVDTSWLFLPFRRPSIESVADTGKQDLEFKFYSQGVPVFENKEGQYVDYKGQKIVPISENEPVHLGPRLRANPPLRYKKATLSRRDNNSQ